MPSKKSISNLSQESYPVQRNLDGYYFRVQRNGKWLNICFTDLSAAERKEFLKDKKKKFVESLLNGVVDVLRNIADACNLKAIDK